MSDSTASSSSSGDTEAPCEDARDREAHRERLPPSTLRAMQILLAGPRWVQQLSWCSLSLRIRAWSYIGPQAAGLLGGLAVLLLCDAAGPTVWLHIGWAGMFVWIVVGVAICESTQQMAFAVVGMIQASPELLQPSESTLDQPLADVVESPRWRTSEGGDYESHFAFLGELLRSRVSVSAARKMKRAVKLVMIQVFLFIVLLEVCFLGMALFFQSAESADEEDEAMNYAVLLVAAVSCPVCGAIGCGFLLFFKIPCDVAVDRIQQKTRRIKSMTAATADWNAVMGAVQYAHETTVRLGVLLHPPLASFQLVGALSGSWWFVCGIAPRANIQEGNPLRDIFGSQFFAFAALMVTAGSLWPLYYPAAMTKACDDLLVAITRLRTAEAARCPNAPQQHPQPQHQRQQQTSNLASPNDLIRIQGIETYAAELNRRQGIGFQHRYKLITYTFVVSDCTEVQHACTHRDQPTLSNFTPMPAAHTCCNLASVLPIVGVLLEHNSG